MLLPHRRVMLRWGDAEMGRLSNGASRVTALHSRTGLPSVGGYGPAQAVKEALTRDLSAELAPYGIRVIGLRPQACRRQAR
jgi:NAD(P)-dependent dehydrogenase (short-subunit alcohol dehydrogenase family)